MIDAEKVIRGLDACTDSSYECGLDGGSNPECPYHEYKHTCLYVLMVEALRLINEQNNDIRNLTESLRRMNDYVATAKPMFYPCGSCQEYHCDFCEYKNAK